MEGDVPIGGGGERTLLGTGSGREGLTDENPDTTAQDGQPTVKAVQGGNCLRSPCRRIAENEEAGRDNHKLANALVVLGVTCRARRSEHEQPRRLPHSANDERDTTTVLRDSSASFHDRLESQERTFSMTYKPRNVQTKLTAPTMIWVTNESDRPTDLNTVVP